MKSKNTQGFLTRGEKLYVQGSIDGVFKKYSTGLKDTVVNRRFLKVNHRSELLRIHAEKTKDTKTTEQKLNSYDFVQYAEQSLELNAHKRRENTVTEYKQMFDTKIKPYFIDYKLQNIKRHDLEHWQKALRDQGLSGKRINNIRSVFNFILEDARKDELIEKNYFTLVDREKIEKPQIQPFNLDEVNSILNTATDWYKDMFQIYFFTGMRTGELLALKWEDINFHSKEITIKSSIRKGILDKTKTNETRTIDMLPLVEDALLNQKKRTYLKNSFVFLSSTGSYITDAGYIRKGVWTNTLKLCELNYRPLYQTRHTFASNMISHGEDITWVSQMLGHANIKITLDTYTKFIKKQEVKRASFLNNFGNKDAECEQTTEQNILKLKKVS